MNLCDHAGNPLENFSRVGIAIADRPHHARCVIFPAEPRLDEIPRHHRDRLRVARLGEPDCYGAWGHEYIVP